VDEFLHARIERFGGRTGLRRFEISG